MPEVNRSPLLRYGAAILLVLAATAITWALQSEQARTPFAFYFIALVVATLYGGRGPGILAIALSASLSTYFILPPRFSFAVGREGLIQLGVFFFVALVISSITERARRAESRARLSEDSLRITLESIGDAVIATDERGRVTYMNHVAQSLTGWKLSDAKGKELAEVFRIINEHSRAMVESPVDKVLREGAVVGLANHTMLVSRDGREIPIDDSGAPIKDEEGNTTGVVLVFHDITERRQSEDAVLKLAAIVESTDDAIFGKTLAGVITSWNRGAQKLYGYAPEEAIGQPVSLLVPPDRPDEVHGILNRLKAGEHIEHFETVRRKKSGEQIQVSLTISPTKNEAGEITGASTIARDITERKGMERALRQSEERFAKAFASSPLALTITSLQTGRLLEVNETFTQLSGYTREEAVGHTTLELGLWSRPADREEELAAIAREGRLHNIEYRFRMRDGRELVGMLSAEQIEIGGQPCALTVIQDVTEKKRAEAERERLLTLEREARIEAEEANRLKDEFLATLSHELRTPLTAMLGWTRMLRMRQLDEHTSAHALETIERNVRVQTQLIEDLLDVSRIITGKLRLDTRPVELLPVIESAINSIQPAAEAKEITLERAIDPTASPVLGDPARLQQVVWNLLSNAVKFTPKSGRIRVRLERLESYAAFTVTDSGIGISRDFLPFVFDRFRQADSSSTRSHGGLGLGLAIVRHLVELHGGTVAVESDGAQRGSSFTVKLPLVAVNIRRQERGLEAGADGKGIGGIVLECPPQLEGVRVLVVDDEADARQLLALVLGECEAVVETAASVSEALEAIRRLSPDLLISDIGMPDEDGYELVRRLRADEDPRLKELPAVALTAYASENDRARALEAGFQIHLAKPVDPATLISAVEQLVKKDKPRTEEEN
jgi:PAS domain S-box-containing protein